MRHNSPHLLSCIPGHRFCPRARLGARLLDTDGSCPAEDPQGATCHARQASWPEQDRDSSPGFGCREPPPPAGRPESRLPFLPERCRLHCNHTIMMPLKCHICSISLRVVLRVVFLSHIFFLKIFLFIYLAASGLRCGRDRTWVACIGSSESYPLDHQRSPPKSVFNLKLHFVSYCV